MPSDRVTCGHCGGTGHIELTGVYADTLALLRRQRAEITGADLAKVDGCKETAMNNRLAMLESHGFAKSRRYGRKRLFKAVKTLVAEVADDDLAKGIRSRKDGWG